MGSLINHHASTSRLIGTALFAVYVLWGVAARARVPEPPRLAVSADEAVVVGYGSLMSRESIGRSLGRSYLGPLIAVEIVDFERDLSAVMPNDHFYAEGGPTSAAPAVAPEGLAYFNLRPKLGGRVRAVVFVAPRGVLAALDYRERIYERVDLSGHLRGVAWTGRAWSWIAHRTHLLENWRGTVAVRRTYLETVESGAAALGQDFARDFAETTKSPAASGLPVFADRTAPNSDPFGYASRPAPGPTDRTAGRTIERTSERAVTCSGFFIR